ncbi:MAG: hypothetical protein VKO65_04215 [Cyanobacteriota bacterium]|nr:hypothetical protein [Cyanobacteriota bacterium]
MERRLTVAVSWAVGRAASLDSLERYEDSYAITQEFRDWIMALESHPEILEASVLMVPLLTPPGSPGSTTPPELDGLLEI